MIKNKLMILTLLLSGVVFAPDALAECTGEEAEIVLVAGKGQEKLKQLIGDMTKSKKKGAKNPWGHMEEYYTKVLTYIPKDVLTTMSEEEFKSSLKCVYGATREEEDGDFIRNDRDQILKRVKARK